MDDILKYAIENGIIDLSHVQSEVEMSKREEFLKMHSFKIWQGEDQYWRTHLIVDGTRKLLKRKNKSDLENMLVEFYRQEFSWTLKTLPVSDVFQSIHSPSCIPSGFFQSLSC